ncbi:hypothetical protein LTR86_009054 [Recurvomyces mirabilis]|nr:hypothetical protein LTR86_009054 [Recurvomyces mirabilis]
MERYTYRSLDKTHKEVRVLDVLPGSGKQTVRCRMRHAFLTSDRVPEMRRKRSVRTLWIDAVCINQSDRLEREWQVRLMKEIYSATVGCLVYLGDGKALAKPAAKSLKILQHLNATSTTTGSTIQPSRIDVPDGVNSDAIEALFLEPWFTRLWILQEVVLPCQTICHWGSLVYDLRQLVTIGDFLLKRTNFTQHTNFSELFDRLLAISRISDMLQADESELMRFAGASLSVLHVATKYYRASDNHDYVYGMLGLCKADTLSRWSVLLEPRYTKPIRDVFRDATRAAIEEARSLDILTNALHYLCWNVDTVLQASPSWVVSWDHSYNYHEDASFLLSIFRPENNHTIIYEAQPLDQDLLLLGSVDACQVVAVSRPFSRNSAQVSRDILEIMDFCLEFAEPTNDNHINIREKTDIGPALVGGRNVRQKRTSSEAFEDMLAVRSSLQREVLPPTSTFKESSVDSDEITREGRQYLQDIQVYMHRRKAFVTSSGQVGIGPDNMEVHDKVVVLYGSRLPFILRHVGDEYRLLGPCYLQGTMVGEAIRQHIAEGKEHTMFAIR